MAYITNVRIKNRVAKVFDLLPEQVVSESRMPLVVQAKCAYILSVHLLGNDEQSAKDEISKGSTTPFYYIDKGIDFFKSSPRYRERIEDIVGYYDYDVFEKFRARYSLKIEERVSPRVEEEPQKKDEGEKLFYFTPEEDAEIERAKKDAEKFFDKYGQGHEPDKILMINKRRYDN